jgi:hypothetical protein
MGAFAYLRSNPEHGDFFMQSQTHKRLGVIKADSDEWRHAVRQHIEEGWNFVLVLPNKPKAIEDFCRLFGLPHDCNPKTLTRSDLFRLSQFVEPDAFDDLLASWDGNSKVVFVEQLDFPVNRPPRLQTFLVYSHVLGILAQAPTMSLAKEALADYEGSGEPGFPDASIYIWHKNSWKLYEGR